MLTTEAFMPIILFLVFAVLVAADIYLTYKIIKAGGRELNPIVAWLIKTFWLREGLIFAGAVSLVAGYMVSRMQGYWLLLLGALILIEIAVVVNNVKVLKKQKAANARP